MKIIQKINNWINRKTGVDGRWFDEDGHGLLTQEEVNQVIAEKSRRW